MKQVTKGIVLSKVNYSESSLIVSVYTLDFGIQSFLFQGGKKKASAIYPLALVECTYYKRPESDLAKATELTLYKPNNNITMHHGKMVIAYFVSAVIKACFKHGNHDITAYAFLEGKICELNDANDVANFPIYFLLHLSDVLGISPQLNDENSAFFYLEDGEFSNALKMNVIVEEGQHVAHLQQFLTNADLTLNAVPQEIRKKALDTLVRYYQIHISGFQIEQALEVIRSTLYD